MTELAADRQEKNGQAKNVQKDIEPVLLREKIVILLVSIFLVPPFFLVFLMGLSVLIDGYFWSGLLWITGGFAVLLLCLVQNIRVFVPHSEEHETWLEILISCSGILVFLFAVAVLMINILL